MQPTKIEPRRYNYPNSPITCNEIKTVIVSIQRKSLCLTSLDLIDSQPYFAFKEELTPVLFKLFQEIERERTLPN
jgi:hypothetical protein